MPRAFCYSCLSVHPPPFRSHPSTPCPPCHIVSGVGCALSPARTLHASCLLLFLYIGTPAPVSVASLHSLSSLPWYRHCWGWLRAVTSKILTCLVLTAVPVYHSQFLLAQASEDNMPVHPLANYVQPAPPPHTTAAASGAASGGASQEPLPAAVPPPPRRSPVPRSPVPPPPPPSPVPEQAAGAQDTGLSSRELCSRVAHRMPE